MTDETHSPEKDLFYNPLIGADLGLTVLDTVDVDEHTGQIIEDEVDGGEYAFSDDALRQIEFLKEMVRQSVTSRFISGQGRDPTDEERESAYDSLANTSSKAIFNREAEEYAEEQAEATVDPTAGVTIGVEATDSGSCEAQQSSEA